MAQQTPPENIEPASTEEIETSTDAKVEALVEDELLVEEISIDGMCGVY